MKPWSWINTGDDSLLSSRPYSAALLVPCLTSDISYDLIRSEEPEQDNETIDTF